MGEALDHVIMTSDTEWNPKIADSTFAESKDLIKVPYVSNLLPRGNTYDIRGDIIDVTVNTHSINDQFNLDDEQPIGNGNVLFNQSETLDIMESAMEPTTEPATHDTGCIDHLYKSSEFPSIHDFFDDSTL